ncbi:MAG TPA: DUF2911 domain-containing protein [Chitinophagaceae bacterium]|nr:DUF2911 domain-containing protein [Chitinophagaceae bacterium]
MKRILLVLAVFATVSSSGQGNQRKSPHDTVTYANGMVTYGRPYKSGREIFGGLVEFGKVWRLGADEATTISFNSDTKFGGEPVPKGTYTMFAEVNKHEWKIILNSQLGQWGAFSYEKNKDKDIAKVKVPVMTKDPVTEQLTIRFDEKNNMIIEWDQTMIIVPLSF